MMDTIYTVLWFDPWKGNQIENHVRPVIDDILIDEIPQIDDPLSDISFKIQPAQPGDEPFKLELLTSSKRLLSDGESKAQLTCFILDSQDRFCHLANNLIIFLSEGPGYFPGEKQINANKGVVQLEYQADNKIGLAKIIASSPGLQSDTIYIQLSNKIQIDDFERYRSNDDLQVAWQVRSGTDANLALRESIIAEGSQSLNVNYSIGNGSPPYAGFNRKVSHHFSNTKFLHFWIKPDDSNRNLAILLFEQGIRYWQFEMKLTGTEAEEVNVDLTKFIANDNTIHLDLNNISEISFNILKGDGDYGSGELYFDDIAFSTSVVSFVKGKKSFIPWQFILCPSYPNPFNSSMSIKYVLPKPSLVDISIYDIQGRLIKKLIETTQDAGSHVVQWQAENLTSGVYLYKITTPDYSAVSKCILIK
jgi:hypothetical protein